MPIYSYGNGGYYPTSYSYTNGNFTSTTNIVNGIPYTQNIMMLNGTGSGCGDKPCSQGYSLYFPCLRNITRGEDICFEFYVVDNASKDTVDLRRVDGLTINLTGNFGCQLGTFEYPCEEESNCYIKPLQTQGYKTLIDEGFKERKLCYLDFVASDENGNEISDYSVRGKIGKFYSGDRIMLEAFDTEAHEFLGWVMFNPDTDEWCYDPYSTERVLETVIESDMYVAAVYRLRLTHRIYATGRNSMFYYYNGGLEEILENGHVVHDGGHIIVRSVPMTGSFSNWTIEGTSVHTDPGRIVMDITVTSDVTIGIETTDIQDSDSDSDRNHAGDSLGQLLSYYGMEMTVETFTNYRPEENIPSEELEIEDWTDVSTVFDVCEPASYGNLTCYHRKTDRLLKFGNQDGDGFVEISNPGVETGLVLDVECMEYDTSVESSVSVSIDGGEERTMPVEGEGTLHFEFDKTDFGSVTISTVGEVFPEEIPGVCLVDRIVVSDIKIIDKGKAALCLPGSVTQLFHRGKITANGVVSVDGSLHGLPCALVGNVSGNPVIDRRLR